jgi:hypothetical protein
VSIMARHITWIIIVVVVLWQIAYGLIQKAAEKRQQERMRELSAPQRRRQSSPPTGARTPATPPRQPSSRRSAVRLEDLAARRKAQLEELRRRRASRPRAGPAPRAAGGVQTPAAPLGQPKAKTVQALKAGHRELREAERAEERRRAEQLRREREAIRARERREMEEERRRAAERERRRRQEAAKNARQATRAVPMTMLPIDEQEGYGLQREGDARAGRLVEALSSRSTLRDLFILKELIDPPLALRDPTA